MFATRARRVSLDCSLLLQFYININMADITALSSTPPCSTGFAFSSDPASISTPPSSPPGFPWDYNQAISSSPPAKTQPLTAFSVLGKRKASLALGKDHGTPNLRASKRTKASTSSLTQSHLSLGQTVQKLCPECGMPYTHCVTEDRQLHTVYHAKHTLTQNEGYEIGPSFVAQTLASKRFETEGGSICSIDPRDSAPRRRKAREMLQVVQNALGAVEFDDQAIWSTSGTAEPRYRSYLYVRKDKCIGFLLVENITQARRVLATVKATTAKKRKEDAAIKTSLSALRARQRDAAEDEEAKSRSVSQPLQLDDNLVPACLGISRIWTLPSQRGQGVAAALLDAAVSHHSQQRSIDSEGTVWRGKDGIAFSQPTEMGTRLARRWLGLGREEGGWLVYEA